MERLGESIPNWLRKLEPPPFDDPRYIERCNRAWSDGYKRELQELRERWKKIIFNCIGGVYGHAVRDDWQSEYPGMNPETVSDEALMQAAQAVWHLKGVKCVERMPLLKTMDGDVNPRAAGKYGATTAEIPPMPDWMKQEAAQPDRRLPPEPELFEDHKEW